MSRNKRQDIRGQDKRGALKGYILAYNQKQIYFSERAISVSQYPSKIELVKLNGRGKRKNDTKIRTFLCPLKYLKPSLDLN
jgi:hypothetical protein